MENKIKYLIIGLFFVIVFSQFTSAYSVTFNLDRSGWDYEQYYCGYNQASCDSPSLIGSGYESSNSHTFNTGYNYNYYAAWFFEECHRPQAWWWWGNAGPFYPTFDKKTHASSTFNSLIISDSTPNEGDILDVNANINSAFTIADDDVGTPNYWPDSHRDWYTSDITVSAVVKKSSSVVMTLPSQLIPIYQDESDALTFEVDTTGLSAGTYTVEVTTQCSDCICDQTNDIPVTQTVSFIIEEEEYECEDDSDCGTDGYVGGLFCWNGDSYRNYREYTCNNPGTCSAYCSSTDTKIKQDECGNDEIITSENYCVGKDVYYNKTTIDRGCSSGSCFETSNTQQMFVEGCDYDCVQGECVEECEDDSDCGTDEIITSDDYCIGNDVYYNETTIDRGCSSGSCFEEELTDVIFVEECDYSCLNGECVGECEDNGDCNDGLYCNGVETCNLGTHTCQSGTPVDCSAFDISSVLTCSYNPDNNPFTFDFFAGFDSVCDESTDSCTTNFCWQDEMTHECDIDECGAECETDSDCTDGNNGVCLDNCSCEYDNEERCGPDNQGILFDDYCWYEGEEYYQNCNEICGEHSSICVQPPAQNNCELHAAFGIECNPSWCAPVSNPPLFGPAWQWECNNCYYNALDNYSCEVSGNYYRLCACETGEEEPVCGDGSLDAGEECDDGEDNGIACSPEYEGSCDYCSESCDLISVEGGYCGDGNLDVSYEECDDGNNNNNDGCSSSCKEEDDDDDDDDKKGKGSQITYLGFDEKENSEKSSYSLSFCGNNVTEMYEQCDDGNYVDGDGCSINCQFETLGEQDNRPVSLINVLLILGILLLIFLVILIAILRS